MSPVECLQLGYKVNRFDARIPYLTNAIGVSNQETILLPHWKLDRCYIIVRPMVLVCHCVSICVYWEDAYWTIPGYFLRQLSDYPHYPLHDAH